MDAYLVRATSLYATFQYGHRPHARQDPPVRHRELAALLEDRHALAVDGMTPDQVLDAAGVEARATVYDSKVRLLDVLVRREGPRK